MNVITLGSVIRAVVATGVMMAWTSAPVFALDDGPAPKPKIDCTKAANKNKPACKPHNGELSDDEIFNGAYWLARDGHYSEALALLGQAQNPNDPRLLSATGFVTRKLGNVDGAFPFYAKALAIKPNYVQAREYLGEAYLMKGDLAHAAEQLGEIERRCGHECVAYTALASQIDSFKVGHTQGG
jgi:tetratricopeptide (TPR) repeat protein